METQQKVSLKIQYTTSFGEVLFVSGSFWSNWQDQVLMTWHEGGHWEYVFTVPPPKAGGLTIDYKYLVRNETTGATRWEATDNRSLTIEESSPTGKSLLVTDTWEHPEATRQCWGLTREEEAAEEQKRRAEEAEARKAGLDFFKRTLQNSKRESEARRKKEEQELIKRELQRSTRAAEEEQRKAKILSSRHATMASASPSASSLGASASASPSSESIVINPAMQTDMIYNGTTSPIMPFSQCYAPRYSSSPRDHSPRIKVLVGKEVKTTHVPEEVVETVVEDTVEDDFEDVVDDEQ